MCKIFKEKKSVWNVGWCFCLGIFNDVSWSIENGLNKYVFIFYRIYFIVDLFKVFV